MRIVDLIVVVVLPLLSCQDQRKKDINLSQRPLLIGEYKVPLLVKASGCEGIVESVSFFADTSFLYNLFCLDNPKSNLNKKFRGKYYYITDSLLLLRADTNSIRIKIRDTEHISVLEINGEIRRYDFPLKRDTLFKKK